jgi:hypothetical protein
METIISVFVIICAASWGTTAVFFRWMERREKKSDTKIHIKIK